jgi:hypothetical protein
MPVYGWIITGVVVLGLLWGVVKFWRIVLGIIILFVFAVAVNLGFYLLCNRHS